MHALLLTFVTVLLQMPTHQMPHEQPGLWWRHWAWMVLWVVLAFVIILVIVYLIRSPRR